MSLDRPRETEFELVQRRGREAEERARQHDAAIEAHRRAGTNEKAAIGVEAPAIPGIQGRERW